MANLLVVGSSNTDMVVKTDRFPRPGETIIGGEFFLFPGGKGANQAVAAARLGGRVAFVSRVGDDLFGRQAVAGFRAEGIDCTHVSTDPDAASGTALITVDAAGENSIVVAPGANADLSPTLLADVDLSAYTVVLTQLETPLATVEALVRQHERVVLNPAPAQPLADELLANLYCITPNETEAEILTGVPVDDDDSCRTAAARLLAKGVSRVIITLGARGAYFTDGTNERFFPAPVVQAVDTTAAGDVFNGALAAALANDQDWPAAIEQAIRAASLSVTRMGAQASAPSAAELPD